MRTFAQDAAGYGVVVVRFRPIAGVNQNSIVLASVTEIDPNGYPFVGAAGLTVTSVAPQRDGMVHVRVYVEWTSVLGFRVYLLVP